MVGDCVCMSGSFLHSAGVSWGGEVVLRIIMAAYSGA
jgi:hypothetical protein